MNLIDFIRSILELTTPFVLIALIFVGYRVISSYRIKEEEILNVYSFKKGKTEYIDPPRPLSTTFSNLLQLAMMSTPKQQKQLTDTFSRLINEQIDIELASSEIQYSASLKRLIEDPDAWFKEIYDQTANTGIFRNKHTSEILYEKFIKILAEIQEIFDIPLLLWSE